MFVTFPNALLLTLLDAHFFVRCHDLCGLERELSYRKQTARQLHTQFVEDIYYLITHDLEI